MKTIKVSLFFICSLAFCSFNGSVYASPEADIFMQQVNHPDVTTQHVGTFNGHKVPYTAVVESTIVRDQAQDKAVKIVSFSYLRSDAPSHNRPVLFLFNGGPIVSAMYLQIGGLGPKRIAFPDDVKADPSTFSLVDNQYSPLDSVDLVFIDPASTGYSRVMPGTKPSDYFSISQDSAQVGNFIRTWLKKHKRMASDVYILGESYGSNRAAEIARQFAESDDPLKIAGVYLYGQAANILEYAQRPANIISYACSLPTIAATAWYHNKAKRKGRKFEVFFKDAETFSRSDYLEALYMGDDLSPTKRKEIADKLEDYSGIPAEWYLKNGLKMTKEQYRAILLKDEGLLLGRSDARYTAPITAEGSKPDPSDVLSDAVHKYMLEYMRDDLKVDWPETYIMESPVTSFDEWDWGYGASPFSDWPYYNGITKMMTVNPNFTVIVGGGYYDTQTTIGAARLLTAQSGWDQARVSLKYYDGGHMGYSVAATARALGDDIRAWVSKK